MGSTPPPKRIKLNEESAAKHTQKFRPQQDEFLAKRSSKLVRNNMPQREFTHDVDDCQRPSSCPECTFARRAKAWGQKWLVCRVDDGGEWGAGCTLCAAYRKANSGGDENPGVGRVFCHPGYLAWATYAIAGRPLMRSQVLKHERSVCHRVASEHVGGNVKRAQQLLSQKTAPSKAHFLKVLQNVRVNNSRTFIDQIGGSFKIRRMVWCLAEAWRSHHRQQLRRATTIALHQDKGAKRLHLRFTAAGTDLKRYSGVVGLQTMVGGHAEIIKTTEEIVRRFCTPGACRVPNEHERKTGTTIQCELDNKLFNHMRCAVHVWNADAASDCQLAGRIVQGNSQLQRGRGTFENLKLVTWDTTHASRRLTSRPWKTDPYIYKSLCSLLLSKKKKEQAIVRLIQNSQEFRYFYQENLKKQKVRVGPLVSNLCFAPHRFDSTTKPLGRAVHNIIALIRTAVQITRTRPRTDEAASASSFLKSMSTERILQLAVLADAASEAIVMTRFTDREGCATETLWWELEAFMAKIKMLFVDRKCTKTGYTAWALEMLKTPTLVFVGGQPLVIGRRAGVPPNIIERCVKRMSCWVRMCLEVIKSEFPSFSLFSAFSIFHLPDQAKTLEVEPDQALKDRLERLAAFFAVDPDELESEYLNMYHLSMTTKNSRPNLTNFEAWGAAVSRIQTSRRETRHNHSTAHLMPVLHAWLGWSCTTSGVEQDFAFLTALLKKSNNRMNDDTVENIMIIGVDRLEPEKQTRAIVHAQRLWAENFGFCRNGQTRGTKRLGFGKRLRKNAAENEGPVSEAAWLKIRRKAVDTATAQWLKAGKHKDSESRLMQDTQAEWTEAMDKETAFQREKRFKRLVYAEREKHILPKDIDDEAEHRRGQKRVQLAEKKVAADRGRKASQRSLALETTLRPPSFPIVAGKAVFLDKSVAASERKACCSTIARLRARQTDVRTDADVIVVHDLATVGQRNKWVCALGGLTVMTAECMVATGRKGDMVGFKQATLTKRCLWTSPAFAQRHTILHEIIGAFVQKPGSKWTWFCGTLQEYLAAGNNRRVILGLVTPGDKAASQAIIYLLSVHIYDEKMHSTKVL